MRVAPGQVNEADLAEAGLHERLQQRALRVAGQRRRFAFSQAAHAAPALANERLDDRARPAAFGHAPRPIGRMLRQQRQAGGDGQTARGQLLNLNQDKATKP